MPRDLRDEGTEDQRRQLSRLGSRFLLQVARIVAVSVDRELVTALVAMAVARANLRAVYADPDLALRYAGVSDIPPDSVRRPVSVYAVAKTLRLPYETTRRHVRKLEAVGVCVAVEGGVIVPAALAEGPELLSALEAGWAAVNALVADAQAVGLSGRADAVVLSEDVVRYAQRLSLSFFLDGLDLMGRVLDMEPLSVLIMRYVGFANIEHLVADPVLGPRYAGVEEVPPDDLRRPVSVYAVGKALLIPYETVRRHATKLVKLDLMERRPDGGLVAPARVITSPAIVAGMVEFADLTQGFLDRLAAIGLPPAPELDPGVAQAAATSPV
ncbi:hypothetical protein [Phenylobacterium aquaticum]|uniref:hypothetical protein n=1 Tax=Phenylobacterium aquaticum TaxID=1763816 RepID=UPI0026E94161|nr:hypothetical protein [Phenylobacterium aquaticum]